MSRQAGFVPVVVLLLLLVGIGAGAYMIQQRTNFFPKAAEVKTAPQKVIENKDNVSPPNAITSTATTSVKIENDSDLNQALKDVDNSDLDFIDLELDKNNSDLESL